MKRELRDKWTDRLRNGGLRQGSGALRTSYDEDGEDAEDRYCCLGVLCEIAVEQGLVERSLDDDGERVLDAREWVYWTRGIDDRSNVYLPDVWNRQGPKLDAQIGASELPDAWADLSDDWDAGSSRIDFVLAAANDYGYSFDSIADLIEAIVPVED